jgi:hypothetical protein
MEEVEEANFDVFFEKGLIKLHEKKQHMRNKYRPTEEMSEKYRKGSRKRKED